MALILERFEVKGLAHYSYAVGCAVTKRIAIVDPQRVPDEYLAFAQKHGCTITNVLETHIHADYASGARELAHRTGATLMVSQYDAGERFEVAFPHRDLSDGQVIPLGNVSLKALHTPGHTPEHMSYLVYNAPDATGQPLHMLSGDFLFVGSLGRPDLLGEDAKRELASRLLDSVRSVLLGLPDALAIHPGHGAGSMCGAGMGSSPTSTLGAERTMNPYLDPSLSREQFTARILGSVPPFPDYYRRMKAFNSAGPTLLADLPAFNLISVDQARRHVEVGGVVIDLRGQVPFSQSHIPNSFGIGGSGPFATWASWVVPYEQPIMLVGDSSGEVAAARQSLLRVGLDEVMGWLEGGFAAWQRAGLPVRSFELIDPADLSQRLEHDTALTLLDVRNDAEVRAGHVPGSLHIMGGHLPAALDRLPVADAPIAVTCAAGYRSTVAASVLERAGRTRIFNVVGGLGAWSRAGFPLEQGELKPAGFAQSTKSC